MRGRVAEVRDVREGSQRYRQRLLQRLARTGEDLRHCAWFLVSYDTLAQITAHNGLALFSSLTAQR